MSYIIIFNLGYRDSHMHLDSHYMVTEFNDYEDAVEEAKNCIDGKDYRSFKIYEEDYRKII